MQRPLPLLRVSFFTLYKTSNGVHNGVLLYRERPHSKKKNEWCFTPRNRMVRLLHFHEEPPASAATTDGTVLLGALIHADSEKHSNAAV